MSLWNRPNLRGLLIAAAALAATPAAAQMELKIIAPAAPGGGWDQTARSMQQAMVASGAAKSAQVTNIPGAGGTVGLAQFVNTAKGDGNTLMVNGFVMVGAILTNKSPVSLDQVTPIAKLTEEVQIIVVPANSPIKTAKDLAEAVKKDVSKVTFAGGSAGGVDHIMAALFVGASGRRRVEGQLRAVLRRRRVARSDHRRQGDGGHFRLRRIRRPDQIRPAARDRHHLGAAHSRHRRADLQGAGHRPRHHQLALGRGGPRHQRGAEEGAGRRRREDGRSRRPGRKCSSRRAGTTPICPSDAFAKFLKEEQVRVRKVLSEVGLVKS